MRDRDESVRLNDRGRVRGRDHDYVRNESDHDNDHESYESESGRAFRAFRAMNGRARGYVRARMNARRLPYENGRDHDRDDRHERETVRDDRENCYR